MAIFDDGIKAFLEAYTYFSRTLGKGKEKLAKELAEEATGVKAPEKLEPVIPGNEVIRIPSKVEKGELMSINSTFSDPLKSDFVLSKIDGTAGSKYSVLRSETEKMFPQFTQDLKYIKDNKIALTTAQKNNILNNLRIKRNLQSDIKRLELNLVRDDKNPRMIYEAYTQSVRKQKVNKFNELSEILNPTETYSKAKADLIKQNNVKNKYDSRAYNSNYESAYRQIARNFLIAEQKAGRIDMPANIYQRISFGGSDPMIDPIKLFRYHYGDDAFDKIPVEKLEEMFAKKGLKEQDYKYILRQAGITPIKQKGPKSYAAYATPKELKAELLEIDTINDEILAGDSPIFQTKSEIVNAIKNNNDRRAKFATILKDMEFKKMLDEEFTMDLVEKAAKEIKDKAKTGMPKSDDLFDKEGVLDKDAVLSDITETLKSRVPKKAGQGRFTKAQVLIERLKNTLKTDKDPYVQENFPNFIKELEAKPELANNKNVFDTLGGPLPKNQRLVEYDDGTVDFYTQGGKGGKGMESVDLLAKDLGISLDEAAKIKMMEPEDQILEIQKRKTLMEKEKPIVNLSKYTDQDLNKLAEEAEEINSQLSLVDQDGSSTLPYEEFQQLSKRKAEIDKIITEAQKVPDISGNFANDLATKEGDNVIDIEDYFDKDDMARGGIVSVI